MSYCKPNKDFSGQKIFKLFSKKALKMAIK